MNTPVYANVRKLYANLLDIFEEGKKTGEMNPSLNPYAAREIFVGTMDHLVTRWLLKDMSYSLFDNLEEVFSLMVSAFIRNHSMVATAAQGKEAEANVKVEEHFVQQQPADREEDAGLVQI